MKNDKTNICRKCKKSGKPAGIFMGFILDFILFPINFTEISEFYKKFSFVVIQPKFGKTDHNNNINDSPKSRKTMKFVIEIMFDYIFLSI